MTEQYDLNDLTKEFPLVESAVEAIKETFIDYTQKVYKLCCSVESANLPSLNNTPYSTLFVRFNNGVGFDIIQRVHEGNTHIIIKFNKHIRSLPCSISFMYSPERQRLYM
jgi:hypothetical protein